MSILARIVARLRPLFRPASTAPCLDNMPTRDWADLPAYHPRCD